MVSWQRLMGLWAVVVCLVVPTSARERAVSNPEALPNLTLKIERSGKADQPIVIRAAERGKTRLIGSSSLNLSASYVIVDGLTFTDGQPTTTVIACQEDTEYNRVTNCAITDYNAGVSRAPMWVSFRGSNHRVDHCAFTGRQDSTGLMRVAVEDAPRDHRIDHNYFGQFALTKKNGGETIRIIDTSQPSASPYVRRSSRTVVEFNLFEDCHGEGAEIISNKSSDNIYRGNTFRRSIGSLTLRQGQGCLIERNFFLGEHTKGTMGVRVLGTDHRVAHNYFESLVGKGYPGTRLAAISVEAGFDGKKERGFRPPVERLVLANNTIVDCTVSMVLGRGIQGAKLGPTDCVVKDNVAISSHGRLVAIENRPKDIRWNGNVMSGELNIEEREGIALEALEIERGANGLMHTKKKIQAGANLEGYRPLTREDVGPFGQLGR